MGKLRVLQVLPELNSGGVERGTIEIAKALVDDKNISYVCSNGGALVDVLEKNGSKHIALAVHSKNPVKILLNAYKLYKLIKEYKIDIVHARSRAPAWSCFLATRFVKVKFITTFHGAYSAEHPLKRFYNSVMLRSDKTIAVSNFIKKHIETRYHVNPSNIVLIHRGVDLDYFNIEKVTEARKKGIYSFLDFSNPKKKKVILMPARFVRLKGHLYFLQALKYLKSDYLCLFVGSSSPKHYEYYKQIEKTIQEYGLEKKVFLKPAVSDMPALYSISDIVVSASLEPESFGRTITEAQGMRKIVISTKLGGPQETIINGKTGFLVSHLNPYEMTEALEKVLEMSDANLKKIASSAQAQVVESFSLDEMCKKTLALYKKLVS